MEEWTAKDYKLYFDFKWHFTVISIVLALF